MLLKRNIRKKKVFLKEMKLKCAHYKIDLVEADIKEDFIVLLAYLMKREKLF